jgi:hypothetical protein
MKYYIAYNLERVKEKHPKPVVIRDKKNASLPLYFCSDIVIKSVKFDIDYKSMKEVRQNKKPTVFAYALGEVINHGELEAVHKKNRKLPSFKNEPINCPRSEGHRLFFKPLEYEEFYIVTARGVEFVYAAEQIRFSDSIPTIYGPKFRSKKIRYLRTLVERYRGWLKRVLST